MASLADLINLELSDTTEKIVAEYIWIGDSGSDLRSKTQTLPGPVSDPSKLPEWNYDGSSIGQALFENTEVILHPQTILKDPFRRGNNILVICDCYTPARDPIPTKKQYNGAKIFSPPNIVAGEPRYGIKQEYILLQKDVQWPLGLPVGGFPGPQWEFQLGPAASSSIGNQLWAARYVLERITEISGVVLSFDSKPIQLQPNSLGKRLESANLATPINPLPDHCKGGKSRRAFGPKSVGKLHGESAPLHKWGINPYFLGQILPTFTIRASLRGQLQPNSSSVRVVVSDSLSDLFTRLLLVSNLKEDGITFVVTFMPRIMELFNENESVDVLKGSLTFVFIILKSFPLSPRLYEKKIANLLALLPISRVDGDSWSHMMQKIIIEINTLLTDYFEGVKGMERFSDVRLLSLGRDIHSQLGIVFLLSKMNDELIEKFYKYVIPAIVTLMECCGMILTNSDAFEISVHLSALVALGQRALSLNHSFHCPLSEITILTIFDERFLCSTLSKLHLGSMDLLIAVIKGVWSQLLSRAAAVARMLVEYSLYYVMKSLLICIGAGMALYLAEELMNNASVNLRESNTSRFIHRPIAAPKALKALLTAGAALKSRY